MSENKVTVDLASPSLYAEPNSRLYRLKRRATYRDIIRQIRRGLADRDQAALLEVGTGSGFLIQILERMYPKVALQGLEFDPRLVELTQAKVTRAKIFQGNAESFNLDDRFDVIVSSQVIEHLFNPEGMVKCVHRHLKSGGFFVMTTPNLGGLGARIMKKQWHGFRNDHVSLKTYNEWVRFIEGNGFETVYAGSTFFTGIPLLNRFPLGLMNWALLLVFGSVQWRHGESFVGVFRRKSVAL